MSNTTYLTIVKLILKKILFTVLSFICILVGGVALMKVLSITMQIPELRMANEFSALIMLKVLAYLVMGFVGVCAAIRSEQYKKQLKS